MQRINSKGFTLIELLAVIVIIGILMMVAIPSMTRYIENARKSSFLNITQQYVNEARNMWLLEDVTCGKNKVSSLSNSEGTYYIPIDTTDSSLPVLLESGGKSPWGNADLFGYVKIKVERDSNENQTTKYYIYLTDKQGHGIVNDQKQSDKLERED